MSNRLATAEARGLFKTICDAAWKRHAKALRRECWRHATRIQEIEAALARDLDKVRGDRVFTRGNQP